MTRLHLTLAISALMFATTGAAVAQTVGYAEAFDHFAVACGADINKFCKKADLGGGRMQECLDQNQAGVSAACKATINELRVNLQKRAAARVAVMRICDADRQRLCAGIQAGDGNLLECFLKRGRT
jgi:OmpA-OmpF porin, OOP family